MPNTQVSIKVNKQRPFFVHMIILGVVTGPPQLDFYDLSSAFAIIVFFGKTPLNKHQYTQ